MLIRQLLVESVLVFYFFLLCFMNIYSGRSKWTPLCSFSTQQVIHWVWKHVLYVYNELIETDSVDQTRLWVCEVNSKKWDFLCPCVPKNNDAHMRISCTSHLWTFCSSEFLSDSLVKWYYWGIFRLHWIHWTHPLYMQEMHGDKEHFSTVWMM